MQIYTSHRQNTLYPNFVTLNYKGKKIASFFSGMKTTEFVGAPNFILSIFLDKSESPNLFKEALPEISVKSLERLFEGLPTVIEELGIQGFIIFTQEEDIGGFPVFIYPEHLKVTSKLQADIFMKYKQGQTAKYIIEAETGTFVNFFTGKKDEKYVGVPNLIISLLVGDQKKTTALKKKIPQHAKLILSQFSNVLTKGLKEINELKLELIIEDELAEKPIINERDFEEISKGNEEPEIFIGGGNATSSKNMGVANISEISEEKSIDQMLERIKMKVQMNSVDKDEDEKFEEDDEMSTATKEDLIEKVKNLKQDVKNLNEKVEILTQESMEKDQQLKKLTLILKSIRKYVSY